MKRVHKSWPILGCVLAISLLCGCQPPCQKVAHLVCQSLDKQKELCEIVRQECQHTQATYRRCQALAETWKSAGEAQISAFGKRYLRYRNWVGQHHTMHRGLQLMAIERKSFRRLMRKLLQIPTKAPAPPSRRAKTNQAPLPQRTQDH